MATRIPQLQRFLYSHYFFGGLRQAIGVMAPALLFSLIWKAYDIGMIAAIGAVCVAVIDLPGSPRRYSSKAMLGAVLLGTLTVTLTSLSSHHPITLWIALPLMGFAFSMLTVYGPQGGLMAFACLLIMTMTMRTALGSQQLLLHVAYSLAGGLFYWVYSMGMRRVFWRREEQQTLSVALFATADYIEARSRFYDVHTDLDTTYRDLIHTQANMIDKQQAARSTVLHELPQGNRRGDHQRMKALNLFTDMLALVDTLIATHTDYAVLRRELPDSDIVVFTRDTLLKLSDNLQHIALSVARNQTARGRHSAKAELRAIEFELQQYRQNGLSDAQPEVYALLVQILRRLRNAARIVDRMTAHTQPNRQDIQVDQRLDKALGQFISRDELRLGMITSNLRLDSPHLRYALRVGIAILMTLAVVKIFNNSVATMEHPLSLRSYWVVLTVVVILKPGFAQTRQRNGLRLLGTVIGSLLSLGLFMVTDSPEVLLLALIISCIAGYSLIQVSFTGSAIFMTIMVLLGFHLVYPYAGTLIGERLVDTAIGCTIALLCSYILPWWEHNFMGSLAQALRTANHRYYKTGLHYASLLQAHQNGKDTITQQPALVTNQGIIGMKQGRITPLLPTEYAPEHAALVEADMAWRLTRKNMHIAFSNYTAAFYRMIAEPVRRQKNVPELNNLMIQNHILASQIGAAIPILGSLKEVPPGIEQALQAVDSILMDQDVQPPTTLETQGELATLVYPLRQMMIAAQLISHEMQALKAPTQPQPA